MYANQFISMHSNIVRDETEYLPAYYFPTDIPTQKEVEANDHYMMVVNNYYSPKIYDVTNSDIKDVTIWFKDSYGQKKCIRTSYSGEDDFLEEIRQVVFKIECELAILKA
jgi:hypothetical protein